MGADSREPYRGNIRISQGLKPYTTTAQIGPTQPRLKFLRNIGSAGPAPSQLINFGDMALWRVRSFGNPEKQKSAHFRSKKSRFVYSSRRLLWGRYSLTTLDLDNPCSKVSKPTSMLAAHRALDALADLQVHLRHVGAPRRRVRALVELRGSAASARGAGGTSP